MWKRIILGLLFAGLVVFPAVGGKVIKRGPGQQSPGGDSTMHEFCSQGGKGIGYNTDESCWTATCGNYNWSASVGGEPANGYNTATTAGGNSWVMECTGDGTATGTPAEDNICLADSNRNKNRKD